MDADRNSTRGEHDSGRDSTSGGRDADRDFARRHLGAAPAEVATMLEAVGRATLEELIDAAVPEVIRSDEPLTIGDALSETETLAALRSLADRNAVFTSLIGTGYYGTITPPVILRNVLENPAWYTSYTPYQAEISQGRLEALLVFQTMISDLTGRELSNSSLLDEATAAAEAMTLLRRVNKKVKGPRFLVDERCHPQTIAVVSLRAAPLGIEVDVGSPADVDDETFGVLVQYPATTGEVPDLSTLIEAAHERNALVAVAADLLALTTIAAPGELGADAVVGTSQRFGVPLGFGGPHAGYLATRDGYRRSMPGRLIGVSVDSGGRESYRLALQTREQHIRREKATSNICTAQVLLANISALYAAYHGPDGLRAIAERVHGHTCRLATSLRAADHEVPTEVFFDTITVSTPGGSDAVLERALAFGINLRRVDDDTIGVSFDETTTDDIVDDVLRSFEVEPSQLDAPSPLTGEHRRTSEFLTHETFHRHQTETEMLRYLRRLADKDLALDRTMIPLGSCTMKLNATTEMVPITWPEFADIHPFAPPEQTTGYRQLVAELEMMLADITGYDEVSVQPNAGSQGEFAGLLAIRGYHLANGDDQRVLCFIPSSAHGTNAASAVMAGFEVVVVECDDSGNVDVADLEAKLTADPDRVGALMVTYPSTHGVFEEAIVEICDLVHRNGGQVYLDGANLNALMGVARPGAFGADVSHLNLHKTFCIPHGGGGPGVGPIGVGAHLAPHLPNHPADDGAGPATGVGPISAAPYGSAGILPISWAYIRAMGTDGLRNSTVYAILSANYVAARLRDHYPVLYAGDNGLVAHECILDIRPIKEDTGIDVEDIAKRLIDYGFHAPTMSFPVPGTLMVEPTESESLAEIDRFCEAMIAVRGEIERVAAGEWPADDNPLVNSPHPAEDAVVEPWTHPYSREEAVYPLATLRAAKYWPPVSRIDNAHGDKNLVCACPAIDAYR